MTLKFRSLTALSLVLALAAGPVAAGGDGRPQATADIPPPLDAAAVRDLLSGNTMDAETALERFKGKMFHVHIKADGTLTILNFDDETDTGVWEVTEDGQYCNRYDHTRKRWRKCFTIHPLDDGRFQLRNPDGSLSSTFTMREGNPDNL